MKSWTITSLLIAYSGVALAQATQGEAMMALYKGHQASLFAIKAETCGWSNNGKNWEDLRLTAITFSALTSEEGKKLSAAQQEKLVEMVMAPRIRTKQKDEAEKAKAAGACDDKGVAMNEELWRRSIELWGQLEKASQPVGSASEPK